jgi:aminopeptidase N
MQAHQWFGNLATLDDWTELWINEGFASYFEAVLADAYQPGMGYLTNFFHDMTSPGVSHSLCTCQHTPVGCRTGCSKAAQEHN